MKVELLMRGLLLWRFIVLIEAAFRSIVKLGIIGPRKKLVALSSKNLG